MMVAVAEQAVDHGQPFEIVAQAVIVRLGDGAVKLDRLLSDQPAGLGDLHLRRRHRAGARRPIVPIGRTVTPALSAASILAALSAAVLNRPSRRAVALFMEDGLPVLAVLLGRGQPGHDLGLDAGRQVIGDEGADVTSRKARSSGLGSRFMGLSLAGGARGMLRSSDVQRQGWLRCSI